MLTCEETFKVMNENKENWNIDYPMFEVFSYYNAIINLQEEVDVINSKNSMISLTNSQVASINQLAYELGEAIALNTLTNKIIEDTKYLLHNLFPN